MPSIVARSIGQVRRPRQAASASAADHAERRGLGRRREPGVDRADHQGEDQERRHEVGQRAQAGRPVARDPLAAPGGPQRAADQHGDHEQQRQHETRQEAREVELRDRGLGQHAIDDHVDRRRDQDAERAAGGDRAEEEALVVAVAVDLLDRDRADRRGGRDRGAADRREQRAGADVGVHQPARQPGQPVRHRGVHALGDAGAQQDLAEQDEHRDRDQDHVGGGAPDQLAERQAERQEGVELVEREADDAEHRGDRQAEREQAEQQGERHPDHRARPVVGGSTLELRLELLGQRCASRSAGRRRRDRR